MANSFIFNRQAEKNNKKSKSGNYNNGQKFNCQDEYKSLTDEEFNKMSAVKFLIAKKKRPFRKTKSFRSPIL